MIGLCVDSYIEHAVMWSLCVLGLVCSWDQYEFNGFAWCGL